MLDPLLVLGLEKQPFCQHALDRFMRTAQRVKRKDPRAVASVSSFAVSLTEKE